MFYSFWLSANLYLSAPQAFSKLITSSESSILPFFSTYCLLYFLPGTHWSSISIIIFFSFIFLFLVFAYPKWPATVSILLITISLMWGTQQTPNILLNNLDIWYRPSCLTCCEAWGLRSLQTSLGSTEKHQITYQKRWLVSIFRRLA